MLEKLEKIKKAIDFTVSVITPIVVVSWASRLVDYFEKKEAELETN